jgi:cell division protein FtsN
VKQPGGEEEAIVEARGQVHLMHKAELSAEKNRALQGTASSAVAQAMHAPSTARVLQANLGLGAGAMQRIFAVQVGAFKDRSNARRLKERIESQFGPVVIQDFDRGASRFYCVRVGQVSTEDAARELAERLRKANLARETFSVRLK